MNTISKTTRTKTKCANVEALVASSSVASKETSAKTATSNATITHQISPPEPFGFSLQSTTGTPTMITKKLIKAPMLSTVVIRGGIICQQDSAVSFFRGWGFQRS